MLFSALRLAAAVLGSLPGCSPASENPYTDLPDEKLNEFDKQYEDYLYRCQSHETWLEAQPSCGNLAYFSETVATDHSAAEVQFVGETYQDKFEETRDPAYFDEAIEQYVSANEQDLCVFDCSWQAYVESGFEGVCSVVMSTVGADSSDIDIVYTRNESDNEECTID